MKEKSENKLDQLFRDGISGAEDHIAFREEDWASMEQLLDKKSDRKAGVFRIMYYAAGIAALLLLAIGLYFFGNGDKNNQVKNNLQSKNGKNHPTNITAQPGESNPSSHNQLPVQADSSVSNATNNGQQQLQASSATNGLAKAHHQVNGMGHRPGTTTAPLQGVNNNPVVNGSDKLAINNSLGNKLQPLSANVDTITDHTPKRTDNTSNKIQNNIAGNTAPPDTATTDKLTTQERKQMLAVKTSAIKNRPQFSITVLAASDANAVSNFGHSQTGTNYGLQLSLKLTRKLTVSTGAAYAIKPYSTGLNGYSPAYAPPSFTTNIQANCKVLDIPLNLSYQVYSKGNNALSLGSGLSSYFMLKENYRYDYSAESGLDPKYIEIRNQNKHLFGVLNVNANYQRKIDSRFSIVVQPYLKLPLTGIGNGKVDLKSTGIALGVNWNIGSAFGAK
ncbi:hypothetical protein [Mucilaginibacter flavus]|uniref:hypothetical protein n=1 Tax=Mucilaginibacter flavus TaxID=931504 RepID=UPI0025B3C07F|nr:hypothetical protein [Mucilaginibacter flavus]MDN3584475.1 hypothetical protein [Mucilaginibacter flavus]